MGKLALSSDFLLFALQALTRICGHLSSQNPYAKMGNHLFQNYHLTIIVQKGKVHFHVAFVYLWFWLTRTKILMLWKSVVINHYRAAFCMPIGTVYANWHSFVCQLALHLGTQIFCVTGRQCGDLVGQCKAYWFQILRDLLLYCVIVYIYCIYICIYIHALQYITIDCKGQYSFIFFMNRHLYWNNECGVCSGVNKPHGNVFRWSKYLFVTGTIVFVLICPVFPYLLLSLYKYKFPFLYTSPCEHVLSSAVATHFCDRSPVWTVVSCLTVPGLLCICIFCRGFASTSCCTSISLL